MQNDSVFNLRSISILGKRTQDAPSSDVVHNELIDKNFLYYSRNRAINVRIPLKTAAIIPIDSITGSSILLCT